VLGPAAAGVAAHAVATPNPAALANPADANAAALTNSRRSSKGSLHIATPSSICGTWTAHRAAKGSKVGRGRNAHDVLSLIAPSLESMVALHQSARHLKTPVHFICGIEQRHRDANLPHF
jgi:hypothetical protein